MSVTYNCDICGSVLNHRDDVKSGAHRIKISDVIPWLPDSTHGGPALNETRDLCGECCGELREWLNSKKE